MLDRREFLKGLVAGAAGLMVPSGALAVGEEVQRRWWALGGISEPRDFEAEFRREMMRQKAIMDEAIIYVLPHPAPSTAYDIESMMASLWESIGDVAMPPGVLRLSEKLR